MMVPVVPMVPPMKKNITVTTVHKSLPLIYADTGYPPFQTSASLPKHKPATAGWLDTLDMSKIEHRPYKYNPVLSGVEPVFTNVAGWGFHNLRTEV